MLQTVGAKTLLTRSALPNADLILSTAVRQAVASGASNVAEVTAEVRSRGGATPKDEVSTVLQAFSNVTFLEGDWFTARASNPSRERLRNVARKILSVATPVELAVLREGVRREYRFRGSRGGWPLIVPPRSVLHGFFARHSEFHVTDDGLVSSASILDYRTELGPTEATLVGVLRTAPAGVLDRMSLMAECQRREMNANTFSLYLTYSPIIAHLGTDLWALRGVRVDPAAVEAVREANAMRTRERRTLDFGWTPSGGLWTATRLAPAPSSVIHVPGSVRPYLTGREFSAADEEGHGYGTIRFTDQGNAYGFASFLRQRGADEGDVLVIEYDLLSNRATLRLADEYVLEEISPRT